jgi:hypothetical protein
MGDDSPSPKSAMEDKADAIPDELLGLVFLRLIKPMDLVRAANTCRRRHHIIADESFRVLCAPHGAPSLVTYGSSITILVRQRKGKIRQGHVLLTVCRTVADLTSQMARLTVRFSRHGSVMTLCWPRAHLARFAVTPLAVADCCPLGSFKELCQFNDWPISPVA